MQLQAVSNSQQARKQAVDRVQQIVADQQPFIYLVYPNALQAISPELRGMEPSIISPGPVWNIDYLYRQESRR
jgi:peptide/nickel transport system substrate-binding protein